MDTQASHDENLQVGVYQLPSNQRFYYMVGAYRCYVGVMLDASSHNFLAHNRLQTASQPLLIGLNKLPDSVGNVRLR